MLHEQYPSSEDAEEIGKDYPHSKEEITKGVVTTKLKAIRQKYRAAVDSGRKSGHGRVVLMFFESCEDIWGGSPATSAIPSGLESVELTTDSEPSYNPGSPESVDSTDAESSVTIQESPEEEKATGNITEKEDRASQIKERRDLLNARLKGHKQEKLKQKLPLDTQLLNVAQEELDIKKQLLERMNNMDTEYSSHMGRLTSMEKLTGSIGEGFAMMRQIMIQANSMPSHYPAPQASYGMYNSNNRMTAMHESMGNSSNSGHFSYTQSLFSEEQNF